MANTKSAIKRIRRITRQTTVNKLRKSNPKFAKAMDKHQRSYEEMKAEIERIAKERGVKL